MVSFKTEFNGYAVEFSPFEPTKLAVATAQHFGIVGNGRQCVVEVDEDEGQMEKVETFDTQDGLYDCAWSEENENHVVAVSGDGSVKVWDMGETREEGDETPLRSFEEHTSEAYSVDWSPAGKEMFATGSWDNSVKIWSMDSDTSLQTFAEHKYCVYSTVWSPSSPSLLASASGDHTLKVWDVNDMHSVHTIPAHEHEILATDWSKYNDNILLSGSVDKTIKVWDLRNPSAELNTLQGHTFAVRRLKTSPHDETVVGSCSYDMSLKIWDFEASEDALLENYEHHTEFVVGMDFNLEIEGQLASCSWDETVFVWMQGEEPVATHEEDGEETGV
eukprot:gb/GECH01008175.1/.p1 GENE.gb/GECH01008175.1/~~gb/GECH01008175.1/.p1  ORF type:complete len:332 (+),score=77.51 gb/GECH01008175.1/:1-996(+)